ncbi:MAG: methylated-DNA--[protein]-cysteine S-methyltransferase [Firmicutes bacterium]|nr:methylated-DNA--[protein]-cysteine S-methyltransferase [Bacillota bacterium]
MHREDCCASAVLETPVGRLRVVASPRGICRVAFGARHQSGTNGTPAARRHLAAAVAQLREYFAGRRRQFRLRVELVGTPLERRIWQALREIPFGGTISYGALARRLGVPRAARAVGRACAKNPLPVIVPCHRVVAADGSLHGFGGGLWRKQRLLEHEGARPPHQGV